jgi:uncharacterized protein YdeI (BOF family)
MLLAPVLLTDATIAQTPIRDLQRDPGITIAGQVTRVAGNEFILEDSTGQIIVDAGPYWYHQINIQVGERLTILGEYDDYDFDAYQITRENGEVIHIRSGSGRPPWAGGPHRRSHDKSLGSVSS